MSLYNLTPFHSPNTLTAISSPCRSTLVGAAVTKSAYFSVDTRLTALLGETYRSTEAALKELVDNAWDADADNVWITLPSPMSKEPIVIRDDGSGMSPLDVSKEYLTIARDRRSKKG